MGDEIGVALATGELDAASGDGDDGDVDVGDGLIGLLARDGATGAGAVDKAASAASAACFADAIALRKKN